MVVREPGLCSHHPNSTDHLHDAALSPADQKRSQSALSVCAWVAKAERKSPSQMGTRASWVYGVGYPCVYRQSDSNNHRRVGNCNGLGLDGAVVVHRRRTAACSPKACGLGSDPSPDPARWAASVAGKPAVALRLFDAPVSCRPCTSSAAPVISSTRLEGERPQAAR